MGYDMRVFTWSDATVPFDELRDLFEEVGYSVSLKRLAGPPDRWIQLDLCHEHGDAIAVIERQELSPDWLAGSFLDEELDEQHPASATAWLRRELALARTMYLFEVHAHHARDARGWDAMELLIEYLMPGCQGIVHADLEGFYLHKDDVEFQITWDEEMDRIGRSGRRWMAVRRDGEWVTFEMDAGDPGHREAFKRGEVPEGVSADGFSFRRG